MKTKDRILEIATTLFAENGFEATSLAEISAELGNTKQTILYHFESKEGVVRAVIDSSLAKLTEAFEKAIDKNDRTDIKGKTLVEEVVKAVFMMATRHPEVLGILREVIRLGGDWILELRLKLEPYMMRAQIFLAAEMAAGRIRKGNPQFLLLATCSTVIGVATEIELLRAMGVKTSLREAVIRRKELLEFLSGALVSKAEISN